MIHVDGPFEVAVASVVAGLERERGDRCPVALLVVELVRDPDGTCSWLVDRVVSSRLAVTPAALLREIAATLERAATDAEQHIQ